MLTLIFVILMLWIFIRLFVFGIRAAWGLARILLTVFLLPVILSGLVIGGLIYIAIPVLIIIGILSLLLGKS